MPTGREELLQLRTNTLEQYATVCSEIDMLCTRKSALKRRAHLLLEDLRSVTGQINQLQAKAEEPKKEAPIEEG